MKLPISSDTLMPNSCMTRCASSLGFNKLEKNARKPVPARFAPMPRSLSNAIEAETSSILAPSAAADGPAYVKACDKSATAATEISAPPTSASIARCMSVIGMSNTDIDSITDSAAS